MINNLDNIIKDSDDLQNKCDGAIKNLTEISHTIDGNIELHSKLLNEYEDSKREDLYELKERFGDDQLREDDPDYHRD